MRKRKMTINIDEAMYSAHKLANRNASEYINTLLKDKFINDNHDKLVDKLTRDVGERLSASEPFMREVRQRVRQTGARSSGHRGGVDEPIITTEYSQA